MKLINKTISFYLLISIPLLCLAGLFAYYSIQSELNDATKESLIQDAVFAESMIEADSSISFKFIGLDSLTTIMIVPNQKEYQLFSDTMIYSNYEREIIPYKVLKDCLKYKGKSYLVTIYKMTLEEEELMEGLFSSFLLIIAFLLLAFFVVNWWLSKKLWQPFYHTLSQLNEYDIKQHDTCQFDKSSISEFNQLNAALSSMTNKLYNDFLIQKEFTENASHEMQTPLAVLKANLSLLFQSSNLKEEEMNQLLSIENTVKKLTALNKALILLSKIENHQFNESVDVNVNDKIRLIIKHHQDFIDNKNITLETKFENVLISSCNATLADVLMTNLLQNAIKHNHSGGNIHILVVDKKLVISNTGEPLFVPEDQLFVRFKKSDASKDSLGLGLSIVQSIASLYNIKVSYHYSANKHTFTLNF